MSATPQVLLGHHLKALRLPTFLREYDKVARQCAAEGLDHVRYLLRLAELEMIDREQRLVERRIRAARFPSVKSLDSYDFTALPSLNKALVLELARCEYLARRDVGRLREPLGNQLRCPAGLSHTPCAGQARRARRSWDRAAARRGWRRWWALGEALAHGQRPRTTACHDRDGSLCKASSIVVRRSDGRSAAAACLRAASIRS